MYAYVPSARAVAAAFYLQALKHFSFVSAARCTLQRASLHVWERNPGAGKDGKVPISLLFPPDRLQSTWEFLVLPESHGVEQLAYLGFSFRSPDQACTAARRS